MATEKKEINNILEDFERTLKVENLKENKTLVMLMDDNLSIHMYDYLANQSILKQNFDKEKLIEAIKLSDKYTYDPSLDLIKLKYQPKRKTIVFRDIPKDHQKKEKIQELFDFSGDKKYHEKIKNIEDWYGLFFVYFHDEETCLEIYKWIEKLKENEKDLPFYFTAFVKVENLKKELLNMDHDDEEDFSGIFSNPLQHKPRKLSAVEQDNDLLELATKIKHSFSKFDKFDPFLHPLKNRLHQAKMIGPKNKFDDRFYSNGENENKRERRTKAFSINYYHNDVIINRKSHYVPLNKDYPLSDEKIEHAYTTEEITKIFINMNFLKKFELPNDLKINIIKDVFNKNPKTQLDQFKKISEVRIRSNTVHNPSNNKNKFDKFENKNKNNSHNHQSKFVPVDDHDEYNNLREGGKHSLRT